MKISLFEARNEENPSTLTNQKECDETHFNLKIKSLPHTFSQTKQYLFSGKHHFWSLFLLLLVLKEKIGRNFKDQKWCVP